MDGGVAEMIRTHGSSFPEYFLGGLSKQAMRFASSPSFN